MLKSLSVSNIVVIERLTLSFDDGLTVLTGETGAGKSILLDALGLALGNRANARLIRQGAESATATAIFEPGAAHPAWERLAESGIDREDQLILRRQVRSDGKSSAKINDTPVSAALLREVGDGLVEIHGQFEGRGLLDASTHIHLLDRAADNETLLGELRAHLAGWKKSTGDLELARAELQKARTEEEWLRDAIGSLDALAPKPGEQKSLESERDRLANFGKIREGVALAEDSVSGASGAQILVGRALAAIEKVQPLAGGMMDGAKDALESASAQLDEAAAALGGADHSLESDPKRLEAIDDRLHELHRQARKHGCTADQLGDVHEKLGRALAGIEDSAGALAGLSEAERKWAQRYAATAADIAKRRVDAARSLDATVARELKPLKLEGATFHTRIVDLPAAQHGPLGSQQVRFEASTGKGMKSGPIDRIASGGELARFMLAIKVALEDDAAGRTLIFDEVDSGVGGAVASAVGERLARLGDSTQTLVVTHSPQVAAKGDHHLRITRTTTEGGVVSDAEQLAPTPRTEEIARMLAGATITSEARAAAVALLKG